jgi:hypothetical protein
MKFTRFTKITVRTAAAGLTVLAVSLMTGSVPASAQNGRTGQLRIVKDCGITTNPANTCQIVSSNLAELPYGSLIFYAEPAAALGTKGVVGANGVMDSNIFIWVPNTSGDWAVGRCTLDLNTGLGVCTLSYGSGPLATISVRANVSHIPGTTRFNLDGTYTFNPSGN